MDRNEIMELIREKSQNDRLTCPQAMEIANKAGIEFSDIGKMLDEMKIKITSCQLGCF